MSVVVRMEMPTNCAKCDLHYRCAESRGIYGFDAIREMMRLDTVNDKREDEHCLFVCSLPEGHGRLGDLDALTRSMLERKQPLIGADSSKDRYRYMQWLADFNAIKDAKTIVPAERSETEQV